MEEECPICLEPLKGTIVHLECCKNKIHIQCYLTKCPFCRASLPSPHVVVPVPVPSPSRVREPSAREKILPTLMTFIGLTGFVCLLILTRT